MITNNTLELPGITGTITIAANGNDVTQTAAKILLNLLTDHGTDCRLTDTAGSTKANITISVYNQSSAPDDKLEIASVKKEYDAYQILQVETGSNIRIIASNPRSTIFGVYALFEALRQTHDKTINIFEKAYFKDRVMCPAIQGRSDRPENMKYLTRIGVNTTYLRARMCPITDVKHFNFYVRDDNYLPSISAHNQPSEDAINMASGCHELAAGYGLDTIVFMDEPAAIASKNPKDLQQDYLVNETLQGLDEDMTGPCNLKHYREDGWMSLSVFHPKVEAHYREMMGEMMKKYPRLRALYLYNEDAAASNCYPPLDPSGKEHYPDGFDGFPYKAYTKLADILQSAAREYRPDFSVFIPTFHWGMDDNVRNAMLAEFPQESSMVMISASDCVPYFSKLTGWAKELSKAKKETRPDVEMLGEDDFTGSNEDQMLEITAGYPMPIRVWKKLRLWANEGATGVMQHHVGGPTFGVNSINDVAFRIFSWNPLYEKDAAYSKFMEITEAQLGDKNAAEKMFKAFEAVDRCQDADEEGDYSRPYQARFGHCSFFADPLLFSEADKRKQEVIDYFATGTEGKPEIWLQTLSKEKAALADALKSARESCELCPENKLPYYIYQQDDALTSCKAYAQAMTDAIELMYCFKRSMVNRMVFSQVEGSDQELMKKAKDDEIANMKAMEKALARREKWLQSAAGKKRFNQLVKTINDKLAAMEHEKH